MDDGRGRLFVAGGATGRMYVYAVRDGRLLASLTTARTPTFLTDSQSPVIYRRQG